MTIMNVRELVPLAQNVRVRNGGATHCCAHIVLDDPNYSHDDARWCLEWAIKEKHSDCIALCARLVACSRTQRVKLSRLVWQ